MNETVQTGRIVAASEGIAAVPDAMPGSPAHGDPTTPAKKSGTQKPELASASPRPDAPLIVGSTEHVIGHDLRIIDKTVHPDRKRA